MKLAIALALALTTLAADAYAAPRKKPIPKNGIIRLKPALIDGKVPAPRVLFILPRTQIAIDDYVSDNYFDQNGVPRAAK